MFFPRTNRCSALLKCAQELITEYEKRNKKLESENLKLIGLAYPLTSSPKTEATPMLTVEDQNRAIELSDAANRALNAGNTALGERLTAEAEKLLRGNGPEFEDWAAIRNYNIERFNGAFVSKMTQELYECWLAAGGSK